MKIIIEFPTTDKRGYILKQCAENGDLAGKYVSKEEREAFEQNKDFATLAEFLLSVKSEKLKAQLAETREQQEIIKEETAKKVKTIGKKKKEAEDNNPDKV